MPMLCSYCAKLSFTEAFASDLSDSHDSKVYGKRGRKPRDLARNGRASFVPHIQFNVILYNAL
jgi:hypothetical protein